MNWQELLQFHFLRPWWLVAIIPALVLVVYFWRQKSSAINWRSAIDPTLLNHLIEDSHHQHARWPLLLMAAWIISSIALAGPSWQKLPQPVHQRQDALVIVLDLSLSMYAEDIKPSRLTRAQHKVIDVLKQRNEGLSGLIAYSGDAHVVSPLSDDNDTMANLLPALSPEMMPAYGSNPVAAIEKGQNLFKNAGINNGRILLISDELQERDIAAIMKLIEKQPFELSLLGVGTITGAPIPTSQGFLKDQHGTIVTPQLNRHRFEQLAAQTKGRYTDVALDNSDLEFLLPPLAPGINDDMALTDREFDQWRDHGPLLVLCLLPLCLLAFRRGWLLIIPLFILFDAPSSYAFEWQDLWQTKDQQAQKLLDQGDPEQAANRFKDPQRQGAANYKANQYDEAATAFAKNNNADARYNQGTALARAGKLEEAIKRFDEALALDPTMEDAIANKKLVEELLKQQQSSDQSQNSSDQQDNQQDEQSKQQQGNQSEQQQGEQSEQQQGEQSEQQQGEQSEQQQGEQSEQQQGEQSEQQQGEQSEQQQGEQSEQQQGEQSEEEKQAQQAMKAEAQAKAQRQKQATEQWLRQIPDDPSGLLRRKFKHEHQLRRGEQTGSQGEQPLW